MVLLLPKSDFYPLRPPRVRDSRSFVGSKPEGRDYNMAVPGGLMFTYTAATGLKVIKDAVILLGEVAKVFGCPIND